MTPKLQRTISRFWPVTLIVLIVCVPWLVAKSYKELKVKL